MISAWLNNIPLKSTTILFLSSLSQTCSFSVMLGYMPDLFHHFGVAWKDGGIYQGQIVGINSFAYGILNFAVGFLIDKVGSLKLFYITSPPSSIICLGYIWHPYLQG